MTFGDWRARIAGSRPSRIGLRLFAFNLLVLFVPVAGMLYLDVYESRLLEMQERGMVQQARLVAASLSAGPLDDTAAAAILARVEDRGESRIRVYSANGTLLADSGRFGPRAQPGPSDSYSQIADPRRRLLYRIGAKLVQVRDRAADLMRQVVGRTVARPSTDAQSAGTPVEVRAALAGRYRAASRRTPGQRSLTLSSAVPIRYGGTVTGAVVVSQSTFRILQALYDVRLRLFEIVLLSLLASAVLTGLASSTIVAPVVRLRQAAVSLASRRGDLSGVFTSVKRRDEIGDLARALEELASRLDAHITLLESFAADVAHEFKNPLAAIRTAAETVADLDEKPDRDRLLGMLLRDVDRLERLVSGVRELARLDSQVSTEERSVVDIAGLLHAVASATPGGGIAPALRLAASPMLVRASADRLLQVFENVVENAAGFSPPGSPVEIAAAVDHQRCVVTVADRGPGIPPAHLERIFDRFFSYRPESDRREHMGLGLSIAKAVVEGYGGTIVARNRAGGGTEVEIRLPLVAAYRQATG